MLHRRGFYLFALLLLLAACGTPPTREEIAKADFGPKPTDPEPAIRSHFEGVLKDPVSARYRFHPAGRGWYGKTFSNFAGPRAIKFGWLVETFVNAKNSFGGYTGFQPYHCWFRGEQLVWVLNPRRLNTDIEGSELISLDQLPD